jgi:hypothetical protein
MQQRTYGFPVILSDWLVHAEHHGAANAQLSQIQK